MPFMIWLNHLSQKVNKWLIFCVETSILNHSFLPINFYERGNWPVRKWQDLKVLITLDGVLTVQLHHRFVIISILNSLEYTNFIYRYIMYISFTTIKHCPPCFTNKAHQHIIWNKARRLCILFRFLNLKCFTWSARMERSKGLCNQKKALRALWSPSPQPV